ncbi:MAG: YicC family protein [Ignavibacteriales bacterium CG_4_9_14_3_um_filter_34_10]|nr:MAG: YicC family protein [Ignavibacteriales bacterium CG_4_9_14_3_um_filter_34_10]
MISSMTGYGKSIVTNKNFSVEVEIKSINSRYLDLSLKIPRFLADKEFEIRNFLKEKVKRGKISLSVFIEKNGQLNGFSNLNLEGLESIYSMLLDIKNKLSLKSEITMENILQFQSVIFSEDKTENQSEFEITLKAISIAIDEMDKMRSTEGNLIKQDLTDRIDTISSAVDLISKNNPEIISAYHSRLVERASEIYSEYQLDKDRMNMELALLSEKYDITEECVRLKSHISQFMQTINNSEDAGRKLNFILQEMNREANTINSKSISTEVTNYGIKIKEEIEKIREQIQNIE